MKGYYTSSRPYSYDDLTFKKTELRIAPIKLGKIEDISSAWKIIVKKFLCYKNDKVVQLNWKESDAERATHFRYLDTRDGKEHFANIADMHDTHWYYIVEL